MISHQKEGSTNVLPTGNKSFLHGEHISSENSKIVYATLDSLALKRARLPLRLLPINNDIDNDSDVNAIKDLADLSSIVENTEGVRAEPHLGHQTAQETIADKAEGNELINAVTAKKESKYYEDDERNHHISHDTGTDVDLTSLSLESIKSPKQETLQDRHSPEEESLPFDSSNFSDYETMDLVDEITTKQRINETIKISCSEQSTEEGYSDDRQNKTEYLISPASRSTIDRAQTDCLILEQVDGWAGSDPCLSITQKKPRYFGKNIFDYVPDQLVKRPKIFNSIDNNSKATRKKKKKKWRTKQDRNKLSLFPSRRLESVKPRNSSKSDLQMKSNSIVTISSPTNFVHVASATNPKLVSAERNMGSILKQTVITHQEKFATLPLLVDPNEGMYEWCDYPNDVNDSLQGKWDTRSKSGMKARSMSVIVYPSTEEHQYGHSLNKNDKGIYMKVKKRSVKDAQSQSEKALDTSSETSEANRTMSQKILPQVNPSFLWSDRTKVLLENRKDSGVQISRGSFSSLPCDNIYTSADENNEEPLQDDEDYDDVGQSNIVQQIESHYDESDYDDVGPFDTDNVCGNIAELNENYDDVISPSSERGLPFTSNCNASNIDELPVLRRHGNYNSCRKEDNAMQNETENQYLSINDDYSSVDEYGNSCSNSINREYEEDYDVYDDVGLANEERVNSLYVGFSPAVLVESVSSNGKESEWEDLEDSTSPATQLECSCQKSEPCCQEEQHLLGRKKSVQRRSRKMKKSRSKGSRPSSKMSTPTTKNSTMYVFVSLGGGSVLLVGNREELEGAWKRDATSESFHLFGRSQGLVQMRVIDLDEMTDTQETSCYVHEDDDASDDSNYETLYCFQTGELSASEETEQSSGNANTSTISTVHAVIPCDSPTNSLRENGKDKALLMEAPTRPMPPPPREASLTQTLGKRIKMLRRTWSITKGSLGRMRKRTPSVDASEEHRALEPEESKNSIVEQHQQLTDTYTRYFTFRKHFRKNQTGFSTFYLDGNNLSQSTQQINPIGNDNLWTNNETAHDVKEQRWSVKNRFDQNEDENQGINAGFDPYSALTTQEPLYQFYAATTARVAYESGSDGYEEMDSTSCSSAVEFLKSGCRTLWCQTPQVINSDLLQILTTEEKKIQEVKFEILTSEASYLNSLRVLEKEFLNNDELCNNILTPTERNKLFGDIPPILQDSEYFLLQLETLWRKDLMLQNLPYILLKHAERCLDIYVSYCSNQVSIDTTLQELGTRKGLKFLPTVARIESRPACCNLSLHSFLMLPMQRITRLPLLAEAVLSKLPAEHSDRMIWEQAVSTLTYIVAECNEGARTASQEAEMEALARKLEYTTKIKPISLKGKQLVKSGHLVHLSVKTDMDYRLTFGKRFHKMSVHLFLLTDFLLVTKPKTNTHDETYTVIDTCKRNLITLERVSEESPFAGRNAMILTLLENHTGRQVEYVLTCSSDTERERWLEAAFPPRKGLLGESLYETWDCPQVITIYPYSSSQPDELSLQPGDIINVLRKMPDGWYHGEKLLDGEQGWFPENYTKEIASEHVRAKNLKQRHRLLALTGSILQQRAKQNIGNR